MIDFNVTKWNKVVIDELPNVGENVLWEYQNGHVIYTHLDANDQATMNFLAGTKYTGPVVRWMKKPL